MKFLYKTMSIKKLKIIGLSIFFLFLVGCKNSQTEDVEQEKTPKTEENITLEEKIMPFDKAKELKEDYYEYSEIMEKLKKDFPEKEILLSDSEKKQLFPELMIGKKIPCHAIQTASFFRKDFDSTEIEGNLEKGTDKLSIKINGDDTISFITATAVEYGETEGEKWNIIANDNLTLIAQDIWHNNVISTLTISKETGLGIWQKSTASGLPMDYKVPSGLMIYLQCYIPEK